MKVSLATSCFLLLSAISGFSDPLDPAVASQAKGLVGRISNPTMRAYGYAMIADVDAIRDVKGSDEEKKDAVLKRLQDTLESIDLKATLPGFRSAFAEHIKIVRQMRQYNSELAMRMVAGAGKALTGSDSTTGQLGMAALSISELMAERDKLTKKFLDSGDQLRIEMTKLSPDGLYDDGMRLQQAIKLLDESATD